jgi:NAD+ kinase
VRRLRVLLLGSGNRPRVTEEAARLRPLIEQYADIVLTDLRFEQDLSQVEADLAVVLGGDGSILRAARQMGSNQIPVLGANLGRLGFLADVSPDELIHCLPDVCAGECRVVEHLMFQCTVTRRGEVLREELGLNETAILGGPPYSMLFIDLYVDSDLVTTYSCDGLIVSTPVGSTAHSLSAGGPILRKDLEAFVVSPLNPHTLTMRPVVDAASRVYELVVTEPNESATVVVDGAALCRLRGDDRVRVARAKPTFKMVEIRDRNYYRTLREKLGWGGNLAATKGK